MSALSRHRRTLRNRQADFNGGAGGAVVRRDRRRARVSGRSAASPVRRRANVCSQVGRPCLLSTQSRHRRCSRTAFVGLCGRCRRACVGDQPPIAFWGGNTTPGLPAGVPVPSKAKSDCRREGGRLGEDLEGAKAGGQIENLGCHHYLIRLIARDESLQPGLDHFWITDHRSR